MMGRTCPFDFQECETTAIPCENCARRKGQHNTLLRRKQRYCYDYEERGCRKGGE